MRGRRLSVHSRGTTLTDVVIVLTILLLGSAVVSSAVCRSRETANRVKCASNLKQVGLAILLYAKDNAGHYPRTTYDPTSAVTTQYTRWQTPTPIHLSGPEANDVTAAMFLLLRTQDITSEVFTCPTADAVRWDYDGGTVTSVSNFPHRGVLSYGYANPYPTPEAVKKGYRLNDSISAEFAVAADMSPGGPALATLKPTDSMRDMKAGNSRNHDGDGQNVLFGDGHVEFLMNPFVGVQRDNIFIAAGGPVVVGQAFATSPVDMNDSVILPTALDGPTPPTPPGPPWYTHLSVLIVIGSIVILVMAVCCRRQPTRLAAAG
jgi:prepilin-type processing-associated H-X9-DG protein